MRAAVRNRDSTFLGCQWLRELTQKAQPMPTSANAKRSDLISLEGSCPSRSRRLLPGIHPCPLCPRKRRNLLEQRTDAKGKEPTFDRNISAAFVTDTERRG